MSEEAPRDRPAPSPAVTALLMVVGVILLLPGLCVVYMAASMFAAEGVADLPRLAGNDPFFQAILILWGICLAISLGGVFLLRYTTRRARMHRS